MNKRCIPELKENEINRVWSNTKTWKTADSEVATLFDLAEGLKKSGYEPSWQIKEEQRKASFVLLDRSSVKQALGIICGYSSFSLRLHEEKYRDGKLGLHPSSILASQDLSINPDLLVLLLGEVAPSIYYAGDIKADSENKELIVKNYCDYIDKKET